MKKCKGTGKATGSGCETPLLDRAFKYGLCKPCYAKWLFETDEGRKTLYRVKSKASAEAREIKAKAIQNLYKQPKKKAQDLASMPFSKLKHNTQFSACNPYIRKRDEVNFGVSISSMNHINDAGHFFSIGDNEALRFSPQNIHGQDRSDNYFKSGNIKDYEEGLRRRFSDDYVEELYRLNIETSKRKVLDRELVLRINKLYKYLLKKEIWIFRHDEFENYLKVMKL